MQTNYRYKKQNTTLTNAFRALRKAGYFARQNFWCCQGCGWSAVPKEKTEKVVFYHKQDSERMRAGRPFYLAWSGDGAEICRILQTSGIETKWNGDKSTRIEVVEW